MLFVKFPFLHFLFQTYTSNHTNYLSIKRLLWFNSSMGNMKAFVSGIMLLCLVTGCQSSFPVMADSSPAIITPQHTLAKIPAYQSTQSGSTPTTIATPIISIPPLSLSVITDKNVKDLNQIKMLGDGEIRDVAFSPGGGLIAAGSTIGIRFHGGQDLVERLFIPSDSPIEHVAFSPNGNLLVAGTNAGKVLIFSVRDLLGNGELPPLPIIEINAHHHAITSLEFSQDSKMLATGSQDRTILIWNPATGKKIRSLGGFLLGISTLSFSADSQYLAGSSLDGTTRVWRIRSGEMINSYGEPDSRRLIKDHFPTSLVFHKNGRLLTIWRDGLITGWDWMDRKNEPYKIDAGSDPFSLAVTANKLNLYLTSSTEGLIRLFEFDPRTDPSDQAKIKLTIDTHQQIISASISGDGKRLITAAYPGRIDLWDTTNGKLIQSFSRNPHGLQVLAAAFSPNSKFLATSHADGLIRIWNAENMQTYFEFSLGGNVPANSLLFDRSGRQLIIGADKIKFYKTDAFSIYLHLHQAADPKNARVQISFDHSIDTGGTIQALTLSNDGKVLASANLMDKYAKIWNFESGRWIGNLREMKDPIEALAFSPMSQTLAVGSADHTVQLWKLDELLTDPLLMSRDMGTGFLLLKPVRVIKTDFAVLGLSFFHSDNMLAISGTDWNVRIVKTSNGELQYHMKGARDQVTSMSYSPKTGLFATGDANGIIRVYGSGQEELLCSLEGHAGMVNTMIFSPDGRMLISGGEDSTIRLWGIVN